MSRFAFTREISDNVALLTEEEFRHQTVVLRRRIGDPINLIDGRGNRYRGVIKRLDKAAKVVQVEIAERESWTPLPAFELLVALPRHRKLDDIIEKAVELGVSRITPLLSERTVVRLEKKEKAAARKRHWEKVAVGACKQSGNPFLPEIALPRELAEVLADPKKETKPEEQCDKIVLHPPGPDGNGRRLAEVALRPEAATRLACGPEGGFSKQEIEMFRRQDFQVAGLGKRILRLETAVVVGVAHIQTRKQAL